MGNTVTKHGVVTGILIALLFIIGIKFYSYDYSNVFLFFYSITVTSVIFFTFFLTYVRYKDISEIIDRKGLRGKLEKPKVSCVLAVYNEGKAISACIQSLIDNTYKNKEIIIVNDSSTDGTRGLLSCFSTQKNVKIKNLKKNIGKKKAIARGVLMADGEIFVFTDSDCVMAPDAIERVVEIFSYDKSVGAVSGHGRALNAKDNLLTKIQDSWYETQYSVEKAFESAYGSVTCVSGPLAAFRKEAIYNYIPAWENDKFLGHEFKFATDRTLTGFVLGSEAVGEKLKKKYADSPFNKIDYPVKAWKIVYCKSAKAWTNVPENFKTMILQQIRWKKSFIRNIFFTGKFYWRKPILPAFGYYLHILFVLAGPFIAFRHLVYLPLQGNVYSAILYLAGITFVGLMFGIAYKLENKNCNRWIYRPIMSLLSSLIYCWLIFYSIVTIKKNIWVRG